MSSYIGRHAQLYDVFYATKPYLEETRFVHSCLKDSGDSVHNLLELACGTGSHAFELEKYGYHIIATDYSKDMLACAQEKAQALSSKVIFRQQDMRSLDIPERPFDAIICLFDSIGYVATNEALAQTFSGVREHLKKDGLFIFEFWHAVPMIKSYAPVRVREFDMEQSHIVRLSETELDYAHQLAKVTYTIFEFDANGLLGTLKETQINRFFLLQEMKHWLMSFGLEPVKWFASFSKDEAITDQTWHIVGIAKKQ